MFRHATPELVVETMRQRGFMNMGTDYAVPLSRDCEMLIYYRQRLEEELPAHYAIFGHLGDAHLHVNMLPATEAEAATATRLLREFATHAVRLCGTVSAEHGLGTRKAALLPASICRTGHRGDAAGEAAPGSTMAVGAGDSVWCGRPRNSLKFPSLTSEKCNA